MLVVIPLYNKRPSCDVIPVIKGICNPHPQPFSFFVCNSKGCAGRKQLELSYGSTTGPKGNRI